MNPLDEHLAFLAGPYGWFVLQCEVCELTDAYGAAVLGELEDWSALIDQCDAQPEPHPVPVRRIA